MNQRATFGLIGAGGISQSQHLPSLTQARNVYLKTVCDLKADLLALAQRDYGIPQVTQNHKELLADPEIQGVVIATRADSHVSLAIEALQAGKHVYVEKPLGETVEECHRVLPVQKKSGRILAVGHNRRLAPAYQLLRKAILAHGGAKNIHYRISDNYYVWGKSYGPGQRILHEVCHIFDLLRYLVGSEVTSVHCVDSRPDDDLITLKFESGCVASIMSSGYVTQDMPKESIDVVMELGAATVVDFVELRTFGLDDFEPVYRFAGRWHPQHDMMHRYLFEKEGATALMDLRRIFYEKKRRLEALEQSGQQSPERRELEQYVRTQAPNPSYMENKGWLEAIEHFADCILDGGPCQLAGVEDSTKAAMLVQTAIRSRSSGQVVEVGIG
ncbi:MAG TPA: hypothetical protein DCX07_13990 [Phycisphaerales bacterium]|nr:hypothetical protein [Phycisphaerales bacterium]